MHANINTQNIQCSHGSKSGGVTMVRIFFMKSEIFANYILRLTVGKTKVRIGDSVYCLTVKGAVQ